MYYVYMDSGTSNTRLYLVKDLELVDTYKANLGSKDSSIARDNNVLIKGLKELYDIFLKRNSLSDKDIECIYASGMVTCPHGIYEVPHMVAPVDLNKICQEKYIYNEQKYFKRPIYLIRGIKTLEEGREVDMDSIRNVNNMRGEEIEIFGILSQQRDALNPQGAVAIFMPGSHTHICYVKNDTIYDCLSTFTGELSFALSTATVLGGELNDFGEEPAGAMILKGYEALLDNGVCRALYMVHASKIFNAADDKSRRYYLEGIISGSVIDTFLKKVQDEWKDVKQIIIAGDKNYLQSYKIILDSILKDITTVLVKPEKEAFSYKGFIEILKREQEDLCQKY